MVLDQGRLTLVSRPTPQLGPQDLLVRVRACGVCRTDLHLLDGDLPSSGPVVPGHEVVGVVEAMGDEVQGWRLGQRVGVAWLGGTCGRCRYCRDSAENLCDAPVFTGWSRDGGYAELMAADARFALPIPDGLEDAQAAPLLCAGLIGFRAWRLACAQTRVQRLGLYGFGAAGHLLAQLAVAEGQALAAFTRPGDLAAQALARSLGCFWAGDSSQSPPEPLDAAILFAPVGGLVPVALRAVRKGGVVVCGGIHMSQIPAFDYADLWGERRLVSVANLTRQDARDYLPRALAAKVRAHVTTYRLEQADKALEDLRAGRLVGAAVLTPS
ncbi:zinc-dependent alcohol dehydrogenase family protein [Caulobacter sp. ErkDOM-YI]|uniref:zinc-dependent alcohol dehydrogenase family protein n=1 Tax=unclassified Caulobacter TaxID=2648921 RepID=UPI003AF747B3